MHRSFIPAGIAAICLATSLAPVEAQQPINRVQVGVLECRGGASIGFVVGSVTNLGCVLRIEGVPEDRYIATIRKVGVDLGITQETALAWGVYEPVARLGPGDLAGDYVGAQGSASVGAGVGGAIGATELAGEGEIVRRVIRVDVAVAGVGDEQIPAEGTEAAVPVEHGGICAVPLQTLPVNKVHRDAGAVFARVEDLFALQGRKVERHFG